MEVTLPQHKSSDAGLFGTEFTERARGPNPTQRFCWGYLDTQY